MHADMHADFHVGMHADLHAGMHGAMHVDMHVDLHADEFRRAVLRQSGCWRRAGSVLGHTRRRWRARWARALASAQGGARDGDGRITSTIPWAAAGGTR